MLNDVLNINPETVCYLILKAKEFHAKEGVTFEEKISDSEYESDIMQILSGHQDDMTYTEIKKIISELEPDQRTDLLALLNLGSGDFGDNDWSEARKQAKEISPPDLTEYMLSKPFLATYLEKGLEMLGYELDEDV